MSASPGQAPPYPLVEPPVVLRKQSPIAQNGVNGRVSPMHDGRHISDLDGEVKERILDLKTASMKKLLEFADRSLRLSREFLATRNRRDQAYIEYAVAYEILKHQVPRHPDYPTMVSSTTSATTIQAQALLKRLASGEDQFRKIRDIIINENTRNFVEPSPPTPVIDLRNGFFPAPSSRPQSRASEIPSADGRPQSSGGMPISMSPKPKPPIRPKPEGMHGNAIKSVEERFAALRASTALSLPASVDQDPLSMVRMPSASEYKTPQVGSNDIPLALRPAGPRPMPSSDSTSIPKLPPKPPKIPLDTSLASSMPREPSPTYSPARNMPTPASVEPPRTTARSIVGTGGRSNSYAALSSPRPQGEFDYFTGQSTGHEARRKGVIGLSTEKSITAHRLFDFLKMYRILLIDMRSRPEYDEGHIDSLSILCIEPLQLRDGISAEEIEGSLSISPDEEEGLFMARDQFDLVVYYDQASSGTDFLQTPGTEKDKKLRILYEALVEFNIEKPLKMPPMLLTGGLEAWTDLLGRPALRTTTTQVRKGPRRSSSVASSLPSSLMIGKKRVRDFNPLNADEEREWAERARSESIHVAAIPDDIAEEQPVEQSLPFYRTEEEFFRRFPAVPVEQQSMVSPMDSGVSSPVSRTPSLVSQSQGFPPYTEASFGSQGDMPVRPAPAAPRVSYSGAHDRNAIPPYNTVRTRYPPPYISPNEKPAMVRLPRTGLVNFGSTCYMNSVLQCLSATVPLTRRFQDGSYKQWLQRENWKGSRGLLPEVYASLVQNLWVNDIPACRPVTFRKFCARLNAEWGTERQQDANDFYIFVMEYLHEDLNVLWRNPPAHVLSKEEEENRERLPMSTAAGIEWDRWSKRERSLISDLFAGQHASQLRCLTCRRTSTTYEPWFNLSVEIPLREHAGAAARLEDCLSSYCQEERLAKGQEWSCPHCRTTRDATKRIMLTKAPQYLVVHLKRFHMDGGSARKDARIVDFPLQGLDLGPWMLPQPREDIAGAGPVGGKAPDQSIAGPFRYNAYAVVEHLGRGLHSGHYIALVHDRPRGMWRRFDDSIVTDRQTIRPDGAYLIFYERINRI